VRRRSNGSAAPRVRRQDCATQSRVYYATLEAAEKATADGETPAEAADEATA